MAFDLLSDGSDGLAPVFRGIGPRVESWWQLVWSVGCYQGSVLLVGGVVGVGQVLAHVVVAEVDALASVEAAV